MSAFEWFARRVTYPLHEALRRRHTLREMRALEGIVALPPHAVQQECAARLRSLLAFAAEKLPYYADSFARVGVAPEADDPFAELAKLPILRKSDVRENAERMTCADVPGELQPCVSGGTSGDTLHFYVDRTRQSQSMGARLFMQELFGVRPGDRRAWLWGSPIELKRSHIRRWRDRLINEIVLDAFDMSAAKMDAYLQRITTFQPRLIFGYTSAVALLARHAANRYGPRDFPWLRVVVLTGDEVHPEHREVITETFGCRVVSEYGSREVGLIAHECCSGKMHVMSPHVHVEVVQDGRQVKPGQRGNVICTNLNTRAQPLIRYSIGDVGTMPATGCDCGLPLPVIDITGARITGFIALPGGRLCHGHLVAYLVRSDPHVIEFKVYQHALDVFEVRLVVDDGFAPPACDGVKDRFRKYFGPEVTVDCRVVDHIPPDPSGKRRHVISDVAAGYDEFEVVQAPKSAAQRPVTSGRHATLDHTPLARTCGARTGGRDVADHAPRKISVPEWLARYVTYPAHEHLRRRRTLAGMRSLARQAGAPPDVVRHQCAERLRDLLCFAGQHLPYYQELFVRYGVAPRAADAFGELVKLPVLEKADVRANADRLVFRGVPGGPIAHSSGGTTGDTLHFYIDRARQAQPLACRSFMQSLFGVRPGDRRVYLWGSPIEARSSWIKRWRDRLLNELLLDAFEMAPAQMDAHLRAIRSFRPRLIYAYSSAAALLAKHAARRYGPRDFPGLRLVVLTGEEVTADQVAQVRETFGCAVTSEYGSRETGLIAHECPRGGLHIMSPYIHVEVTTGGQAVSPGQVGDVVCTTLMTRAQPFIRYRLGDLGRLVSEPCACGLSFPRMRLEGGKITGFIALPEGRLCHGAVTSHVLRDQPGIVAFKTHQRALDRFEVLLVVDDSFDPATIARVQQRYRALFGPRTRVDCRLVERIPPDPSGKRRFVVSDVAPDYADFKVLRASEIGDHPADVLR